MKATCTFFCLLIFTSICFAFGPQEEPAPTVSEVKPPQESPIKQENGNVKLGNITLNPSTKEISFKGILNPPTQGTLEVLIVSQIGRVHEGLVITSTSPYQLEAMLYMLGADNEIKRSQKGKKGSLINIDLEWKDQNGILHRDPIEQWVLDERTKKPMKRKGFFFRGSSFVKETYQAEGSGNLCLLYSNTQATVLDSADKDSTNDILYVTNPDKQKPGAYKPVRVIISLRKER